MPPFFIYNNINIFQIIYEIIDLSFLTKYMFVIRNFLGRSK